MFLWCVASLFVFATGTMVYVYRFRGRTRYRTLSEYLRKSWPVFAPLNCLLYLFTEARGRVAMPALADFPELTELRSNWQLIRAEALELHAGRHFETTCAPDSPAYFDVGFRTFYKYGWSKFYLKWYGYTHHSALKRCPNTVRILSGIPSVNGAMFSVLPPGSHLTRHADPMACSVRYHLGLVTPNSDQCFLNVDGQVYSWRDGEALIFDETYLHFARNDSDQARIILMCDVDRPMNFIGRGINFLYKKLMTATIVPNLDGDRRGLANILFAKLAPILQRSKALKQTNRPLYRLVKYSVNLTLLVLIVAATAGPIYLLRELVFFGP